MPNSVPVCVPAELEDGHHLIPVHQYVLAGDAQLPIRLKERLVRPSYRLPTDRLARHGAVEYGGLRIVGSEGLGIAVQVARSRVCRAGPTSLRVSSTQLLRYLSAAGVVPAEPHAAADPRMAPPWGLSDDFWLIMATGRGDRNLKRGGPCATSGPGDPVGAARGLGVCRAVKQGVDAGQRPSSRLEVLTAPGGARGARTTRTHPQRVCRAGRSQGWLAGRCASRGARRVWARSASRVLRSRTPRPRSSTRVT